MVCGLDHSGSQAFTVCSCVADVFLCIPLS